MENKTLDILKTAILLEKRGKEFYSTVASQTNIEDVKKIFEIMAKEEDIHIEELSKQYISYEKNKTFVKKAIVGKDHEVIANTVLSADLKDKISAASYEAAAISAAIDMENKAIEAYTKFANEATDANEKELFMWLANWEKEHHHLLNELDKQLKEKIWYDNKFWPF